MNRGRSQKPHYFPDEIFTSVRKPFGNRVFESQSVSKFSQLSIKMLDRIKAVLKTKRNIITSLSGSRSRWTHSNTTSPCTKHWMSILITSLSCNRITFIYNQLPLLLFRLFLGPSIKKAKTRVRLIKKWKMIGKTIKFYEKLEKDISNLVRCFPYFPLFSWENFLSLYPKNLIPWKN